MGHVFQVGAGSGGIVVLDALTRDPAVTRVTLVEPDVYKPHNVARHLFPPAAVGRLKAELAAEWVKSVRPDVTVDVVVADLTDAARQAEFAGYAAACDLGVCAVDNEPAKYAFDALMRAAGKPWTLGEVLSGGIGGWVHTFAPGGACYGCVASRLMRTVTEAPASPPPDYADPTAAVAEATVPAGKASIAAVAGLHAVVTLDALVRPLVAPLNDETSSVLLTLRRVPGVFDEAFRTRRLVTPRNPGCLVCGDAPTPPAGEALDAAVAQALDRLGAN